MADRADSAGHAPTEPGDTSDISGARSRERVAARHHELFDALAQPGCAICRLAAAATDRYLSAWIYEVFSDMGNRMRLIEAHGFCTLHTWAIAASHAAFQLAVAYETIVDAVLRNPSEHLTSDAHASGASWQRWWQRVLVGSRGMPERDATQALEGAVADRRHSCPACQVRADTERSLLGAITELAADDAFRQVFAASDGFCLWHFRAVHAALATHSADAANWLADAERTCLERVAGSLKEMIRKHDYRFRSEPQGDEMQSWRLAAELVAGRRGLW